MKRTPTQGRPHVGVQDTFYKVCLQDKADLDMSNVNKLWWYPPQPSLRVHQHPIVNTFLTRHLLLWMPRKLWNMKLHGTWDDCGNHPVTSAGMYPHVRHVLDLDGYYSLVTEILRVGSAPGCGSQEAVFSGAPPAREARTWMEPHS